MSPSNSGLTNRPDRRFRDLLLLSLFFPPPSTAAPVRDSSSSSTWLACLTALLIFSAICLSAFKFLFVRHRTANTLTGPPPILVRGHYVHRSFRFLRFPAYTTCKSTEKCKAGFLIGLFGSPSFEIRPKPSELTLIYPGADTSRSSQKHDFSGDTSATHKTKGSTFSTGPVVLFSEKSPWNSCGRVRKHSPLSASLTRNTKSRFLLPTQLSFDLGRIGRKKKPIQVSEPVQGLPWPHNRLEHATLRLVKLYTAEPEASLPLYKNIETVSGFPPLAPSVHSFAVTHLNGLHPLPISPLPSLPTPGPNNEEIARVAPQVLSIDHPYNNALFNFIMPGRQNPRRASLSPNLSVIEEACHGSLPDIPAASASGHAITSEFTSGQNTPAFVSEIKNPTMTFSAYDTLKRREKLRTSSLRNRRSPPLGPSPLRSMILPDVARSENIHSKHTTVDEIKDCLVHTRRSIQFHRIGLGLPSIKLSPPDKERIRSQGPNGSSSEGSLESMLDFLRELAEETKDWDESIVLDEGFRSMIQRSQAILGCTSLENVNIKCSTPRLPPGPNGRNKTPPRFVSFWLEDSPSP